MIDNALRNLSSSQADPMNAMSLPASLTPVDLVELDRDTPIAPGRTTFLGVGFDRMTIPEVVSLLLKRQPEAPFVSVVTPNAAHVVRISSSDDEVASGYQNAWLCLNDSRVLQLLARTRGIRLPATPGADLVVALLGDPRFDRASPILLVGGDDDVFRDLVAKAGLTNARHYDAPMGLMTDQAAFDATVSYIESHPARYVLLAVGSPQQEALAETLRARGLARGIGLCVGASVEFLVGRRRRAPALFSKFGLEWLFRLMSEPRRMWRRYLVDSPKIFLLYLQELKR